MDKMKWKMVDLPYAFDALEPHIDAKTMEIHYGKHHKAYFDNAMKEMARLGINPEEKTVEEIALMHKESNSVLRNNAGGFYNHALFWQMLQGEGEQRPEGALAEAIDKSFGSFDKFKEMFADSAMKRFGSGWAWLIKKDGKLEILSEPNQDAPIYHGKPILGIDVWEHAYYLKHQNRRAEYVAAFWHVVNWEFASKLFKA